MSGDRRSAAAGRGHGNGGGMIRPDFCPVCERFIGPADVCPYCGEDSARPPVWRWMKRGAWLLALIGLAWLYAAARGRNLEAVQIGRITPMMNFAYVRVTGTVVTRPYVARGDGGVEYLSFVLNDGTGRLRVAAYGDVARELAGEDRLPKRDDEVEVAGSLRITAGDRIRLRVQAADQLRSSGAGGA